MWQSTEGPLGGTPVGPDSAYCRFYEAVAAAQLARWLPSRPCRLLDLSGVGTRTTAEALAHGHDVVRAVDAQAGAVPAPPVADAGRLLTVVAESQALDWLRGGSVDAVVAEGRSLSLSLATEVTVAEVVRVLRPGGRLLLNVDSLVLGLARLAEQSRWAELADAPSAEVVLVPDDQGHISRCFWPGELRELLETAGLAVEWVRPRTVLSTDSVERLLGGDPTALPDLVRTEMQLATEHEGSSGGMHLVASAVKPR